MTSLNVLSANRLNSMKLFGKTLGLRVSPCIVFASHGPKRASVPARFSSTSESSKKYDVVVVGGGIVGMATARELKMRHPSLTFAVLEKEKVLAAHQSGHNSGVIHAGIYYTPGTLKAKLCVEGFLMSYKYFDEKNIPYKRCGKLIVATNSDEVKKLDEIMRKGVENKVPGLEMVDGEKIREIEPYCKGIRAVWSPNTGIVDWGLVTQYYAKDFEALGGQIFKNFPVSGFEEIAESNKQGSDNKHCIRVTGAPGQEVRAQFVVTCGGLQSDRLAQMSGCSSEPKIVPFRGEYLLLSPEKSHMVKGNIYPVPDPRFPFLGVHFTPRMDGSIWLGPNAILAFKREGYGYGDINLTDLLDAVKFKGFRKLALKYAGFGASEMIKSIWITKQLKELQKFIPDINAADIRRGPSGVRAQAMDSNGNLVEDFVFDSGKGPLSKRILHCRNAPSPGATSSLAIAKVIADKMEKQFSL
ncbi:L-2-hydroxyglutarate dehydrogenase, mitochondrial [Neocloeon triangulifer]|uniref:L-2-hydroxyglutarate dehydrogenase, mitochondrial n=1 Tax=Neocloeon triangulifer TaxID=2078957 RepID=UPI00286F6FC7|nr:L-2-hydroxyglutarate dehydrogenase, mitochondrial [Neocloeon triangulifer]XP_059471803.1 L-2-hydroxyglutarate dehydrogenase, mitochondrial [Neocloeon triangulifer]